jgi:chromosomal replication initiation ATPase DnaA
VNDYVRNAINESQDELTAEILWEQVKDELKDRMTSSFFQEFVAASKGSILVEDTLWVEVRDRTTKAWMEDRVASIAKKIVVGIAARKIDIRFTEGWGAQKKVGRLIERRE